MIKLNTKLIEEDFTNKCTFVNCTLNSGKIYKIGRIVFIQIQVVGLADYEWPDVIYLPEELRPIEINSDNGTAISGAEYWVYNVASTDKCTIRGAIVKDKKHNIVGCYLSKY